MRLGCPHCGMTQDRFEDAGASVPCAVCGRPFSIPDSPPAVQVGIHASRLSPSRPRPSAAKRWLASAGGCAALAGLAFVLVVGAAHSPDEGSREAVMWIGTFAGLSCLGSLVSLLIGCLAAIAGR